MDHVHTLMLDGIWGRPRRFEPLLDMLRESCGPAEIFHYDSSGLRTFEELGSQLVVEIRQQKRPANLIGFSMGGLVIRAAHLLDQGLPIHRAVFLNSPHKGTLMAYAFPFGGIGQLRPTAPFIQSLKLVDWNIPTLATWCPLDTMVVPGSSARWRKAQRTIRCTVPIHVWPIFSRSIWRQAVEFLSVPDSVTTQSEAA